MQMEEGSSRAGLIFFIILSNPTVIETNATWNIYVVIKQNGKKDSHEPFPARTLSL